MEGLASLTVSRPSPDRTSTSRRMASGTHVAICTTAAEKLFEISGKVVRAVVVLYARRPVVFACAHQDMLRIVGYEAVDVCFVVNLEIAG